MTRRASAWTRLALSAVALALALGALLRPAWPVRSAGATAPLALEFWTVGLKPKFIPIMQSLVARYQAQHPEVALEWVDY
ncbi:MAG: hypothetical protein M3N23_02440, partial [Pseudomonadota bacterium]|nr:hypothetical protein [Pseudomonadota bacterium]